MSATLTQPQQSLLPLSREQMYDLFAPAVYGKILSIVHQQPIAEKILEKVFIKAFRDKELSSSSLSSPLNTMLNHSREKSYKVIKALNLFSECCDGCTVNSSVKKYV